MACFFDLLDLKRVVLDGLFRGVQSSAQSAQLDMKDALKDLDALMVKAREMVRLARELNDRLITVSELNTSLGGAESDTATFIHSSLAQLGLRMTDVPVTLDMARDERSNGTNNLCWSSLLCCRVLVEKTELE
jgi:ESCRT-II complex subunit VPS36